MKRSEMQRIRKQNYMSVSDLARKCKTTRNNIYLIERGERNGSFYFWVMFQEAFNINDEEMWKIIKG